MILTLLKIGGFVLFMLLVWIIVTSMVAQNKVLNELSDEEEDY